jgi:hypothetical protein
MEMESLGINITRSDAIVWVVAILLLAATIWSIRTSKKPAEQMEVEVASISGD